ncbi:hypothetical protein HU200_028521 [Digitaria exilis]|uniref:Uncharacterized protein n=1 Tax=Digitaria exilis TaxID=1010633 RepID=A0A835EVL1_9POAL|nr:hypothetical protein HU200_028521 [Digitaria exilis]
MASFSRSAAAAATAAVRSAALRSRSPAERLFQAARSPLVPPPIRRSHSCLRPVVAAALASLETLMPLHSAVAAARLRSCIAADSACWSCLSQGETICILLLALYEAEGCVDWLIFRR